MPGDANQMGGYCHLPPINQIKMGEAERRGAALSKPKGESLYQEEKGTKEVSVPTNPNKDKDTGHKKDNKAKDNTTGLLDHTAAPPADPAPRSPAAGVNFALSKKKASTSPVRGADRPSSAGSNASVPRYPGSILHNRDPLYNCHRRERRRRRKMRMTDPSPVSTTTAGLLPKVPSQNQNVPTKNIGYQPSFQFGPGTLPKIGGATNATTTATFLPSLGQAFVKPAKPKQMAQAGSGQPTKNIFGHYQLPSIDRRGGGH